MSARSAAAIAPASAADDALAAAASDSSDDGGSAQLSASAGDAIKASAHGAGCIAAVVALHAGAVSYTHLTLPTKA